MLPLRHFGHRLTTSILRRLASSTSVEAKKTPLYDFHVEHEGKMVPFAGFLMPVQYKDVNIRDSHMHTRTKASIFDVSHMLQTRIHGKDRKQFMERLTVADVQGLPLGSSCLSLFTNESGGIEDDLIITQDQDDKFLYVVTNAGCIDNDKALMEAAATEFKSKGKDVSIEYIQEEYSLIALQGPLASKILQIGLKVDLSSQKFMTSRNNLSVFGIEGCRVTRCGYTGEDGFEISCPSAQIVHLTEKLLENKEDVWLAGLGARDTLRLEAGLCLYGNDIDSKTTPVEAGLLWTIAKRRRQEGNFPGSSIILKQIEEKPKKKRVGLVALETGPAARHDSIIEVSGKRAGVVTSGCPSPSLGKNIAMAYIDSKHSKIGTQVSCKIRCKVVQHKVVKMPFVSTRYFV